ncbi:hypothetical protein CYMTET_7610 [Cymbomonas tetramitiformis]|uniref:Uncharacterized protein n=1 Tax=Cymbomonas tetramitiformis TaxID=36881 RepID=A0AAE0GUP8_9CHLO|nr:hypothetical protein CYMTET_7610 [Cymbomonas tetramitiformis]
MGKGAGCGSSKSYGEAAITQEAREGTPPPLGGWTVAGDNRAAPPAGPARSTSPETEQEEAKPSAGDFQPQTGIAHHPSMAAQNPMVGQNPMAAPGCHSDNTSALRHLGVRG